MSLLRRAREALEHREDSEDGYAQMHRERNRSDVVSRVASFLECEPGEIEGVTAIAGRYDSFLWSFTVDGIRFVAGMFWVQHPGPPGRRFFCGLVRGQIRGKYHWPPDVSHEDHCKLKGVERIGSLADLAEAVDQ